MENQLSTILVIIATIINSIVFGYVASNSKNNKTNQSYLIFLTFVILYTIFDCIIINSYKSIVAKDYIVKVQAFLWMPLAILYLNFIYLFLRKQKDNIFYFFTLNTTLSIFLTLVSNKIIIGYKGFNLGTMAYTGPWFLSIIIAGILPPAIYAFYLLGKESYSLIKTQNNIRIQSLLSLQIQILLWGSILCFLVAVTTNIFFDEILGLDGEIHLASLSLSIQSVFLLPALIKYNFLNQPIEKLGDELFANSSDAVLITQNDGVIVNLNKSARKMFQLYGRVINLNIANLVNINFNKDKDIETVTDTGVDISISQTEILEGNLSLGKIFVMRDISTRIDAQRNLAKSENLYKNLIESSSDIIYNIDNNGNFTFVNKIFENITGYQKDEVINKNSKFMIRDDYKNQVEEKFASFFTNNKNYKNKSINIELPAITKFGKELWIEIGVKPIIKNTKIDGFTVNSRDITARKNAETKLAQLADELTNTQNIAGLGNFKYDLKNEKVMWSDKLFEIYEREKLSFHPTKESFFNEIVHPDSKDYIIKKIDDAIKNKSNELDYIHKAKMPSGSVKWFHAIIEIIYDENNQPIFMHGSSQDITEIYQYQEELRRLSSHIQNLQEEERARIAHEIHDELGQRLTSMNMDLSFLKSKLKNNSEQDIIHRLNELDNLVDETIQITRKISQDLRPSILDNLGLISALEWLQTQYSKRSNVNFSLNAPKNELIINNECATTIFRITQEALTNIIRHADASNVIVNLSINSQKIKLIIIDDGRGIEKKQNNPTFGILGMKERALALGGKMNIISENNKGTTINVSLPIKSN